MYLQTNLFKFIKEPEETLSTEESRMQVLRGLPFHLPGKNFTTDGYPTSQGVLDTLAEHMKRINGQVSYLKKYLTTVKIFTY